MFRMLFRFLLNASYVTLNVLNLIYLIRFQLLALLFVSLFSVLVFVCGIGRTLLEGLFDLPTFCNVFWCSFFSYTLAWTAVTLLRMTLMYGGMRFQLGRRINLSFTESKIFNQAIFFAGCLAPLILFAGIFWLEGSNMWLRVLGAVSGAVFAFAMLVLVDVVQLWLNIFPEGEELSTENMLIPFSNRLYRHMARRERNPHARDIRFIKWLERRLAKLPETFGEGYLIRKGNTVKILPGHIFSTVMLAVFLVIYIGGFLLWYYSYMPNKSLLFQADMQVTSISYVLMLLTLLCAIFSGFAFFFDRYRIPTLIAVAVILAFASPRHHYDARPIAQNNKLPPAELIKSKKDHPYIIVVATNGGGIQAAAWTAKVLSELVRECKKLDSSDKGCEKAITLISSVSGGSVGTMFFVNSYSDGRLDSEKLKNEEIVKLAEDSSLDYIVGGLVYADFARNFRIFNFLDLQDRGNALERSWLDNLKKGGGDAAAAESLNGYLSSWREDARNGKRPAVIFNSTVAETGDKFIFPTSDTERPEKISPCSDDNGHVILFKGWNSFYNVFENKDIKITSAVRLSASFGYVSPAANMKDPAPETLESSHFVDGGYNENYGVSSLLDWLDEALCTSPKEEIPPKILIVQIVADNVFDEDKCRRDKRNCDIGSGWFAQAMAPARTLWNIRSSVQLARNESEIKLFLRYWRHKEYQIEKTVFQYLPETENELAPLSWHLTPAQKQNINTVWDSACRPVRVSEGGQKADTQNREAFQVFRNFISPGIESVEQCRQ